MSDEELSSKIRDAANAAKGLVEAVPIYQDAIQPAARDVGRSLEIVAKTVRVALAPLSALVWGYEHISDYLVHRLSERFKDIPRERIKAPKASVAGPAVEALRFSGQDPDLREMYANLVGTAMDHNTASLAHPAFVEIIRQLSPDEARIITYMSKNPIKPVPVVSLMIETKPPDFSPGYIAHQPYVSLIAEQAKCESADLCDVYLNNLARLGLIELKLGRCGDIDNVEALHNSPVVQKHLSSGYDTAKFFVQDYGTIFTAFGHKFLDACVLPPEKMATKEEDG